MFSNKAEKEEAAELANRKANAAPVALAAAKIAKLMQVGKEIVTETMWQPHDGKTFCNFAVDHAATKFGYAGFHDGKAPLAANAIICKMQKDSAWKSVPSDEAWRCVLAGALVVAAVSENPHGHVAVLGPGASIWSQKWAAFCPQVFNVGKSMNLKPPYLMGENFAFQSRPAHYVYLPSL